MRRIFVDTSAWDAIVDAGDPNHRTGQDRAACSQVLALLKGRHKQGGTPELWDGRAAQRIVESLQREL
jgi:hypothetical protein